MSLQVDSHPHTVQTSTAHSGLRTLLVCGVLLLLGYIALYFLLLSPTLWVSRTLVPERWPDIFNPVRNLFPGPWLKANRTSSLAFLNSSLYIVILAWLFSIYIFICRRAFRVGAFLQADGKPALRRIFLLSAAPLLVLLFVRGMFSTDVFNYIWYGRITALHGGNPYINVALDYAAYDTTDWLKWGAWKDLTCVYGPVWVALAGAIAVLAQVGDGDIVNHILGHRLLADLSHLVNIWLVWRVSAIVISRYWTSPRLPSGIYEHDWRKAAQIGITLTYAWNPLIMIEFGTSGHNDLIMLTCILAAVWLHLHARWRWAVLALSIATMIKWTALLFLPGYLWLLFWQTSQGGALDYLWRRIGRILQALLIIALTWIVCFMPFWEGPITIAAFTNNPSNLFAIHSLGQLALWDFPTALSEAATVHHWQPAEAWNPATLRGDLDPYVRWGLRIITLVIAIAATWRARTFRSLLVAWGWTIFAFLTVGVLWFWPWYVSWLLIPMALVGPGRLWTATQALCVGSLMIYVLFPLAPDPLSMLVSWTGLLVVAPAFLYIAWSSLTHARGRSVSTQLARATGS